MCAAQGRARRAIWWQMPAGRVIALEGGDQRHNDMSRRPVPFLAKDDWNTRDRTAFKISPTLKLASAPIDGRLAENAAVTRDRNPSRTGCGPRRRFSAPAERGALRSR